MLQHILKFLLIKLILFPYLNICFPGNLSELLTLFFVSHSSRHILHGYVLISKWFNVTMGRSMNLSSGGSLAMSRSWSCLGELSLTGMSVPCKIMCSCALISSMLSPGISLFSTAAEKIRKSILHFQRIYRSISLNFICDVKSSVFHDYILQLLESQKKFLNRNRWLGNRKKKNWHVDFCHIMWIKTSVMKKGVKKWWLHLYRTFLWFCRFGTSKPVSFVV